MSFSFDDPQFEQFLADWTKALLTHPLARSVYHIGTSVWIASDGSGLNNRVVPNFVVRTEDPHWTTFTSGMPHGRARHELINELDQDALQAFYRTWRKTGWTNPPTSQFGIVLSDPQSFVRIIEVPADSNWAGPEYLQRIANGLSVERNYQLYLRRYNAETGLLDEPAHYWACDERQVKA